MLLAQSVFFTGEDLQHRFGLEPVYRSLVTPKLSYGTSVIPAEVAYFVLTESDKQSQISVATALDIVESHLRSAHGIPDSRPMLRRSVEATLGFGEPQIFTELGDREKDQPMVFHLVVHFSF